MIVAAAAGALLLALDLNLDRTAGRDVDGPGAAAATRKPATSPSAPVTSSSPPATSPSRHRMGATPAGVYAGIGPGDMSPAVSGVRARVYVPNSESGTVSVIDPHTFRVIRTFPTGAYDQHVTPSWGLHRLYVDNTLTVIDPRTSRPVRTIPVADPYNLYFTPNGRKAIVVAEGLQRIDFRDPHTWRLIPLARP